MKFIQMSLVASTIVLFTACGGVDSLVEDLIDDEVESYIPPAYTGQFVDTYVKGLNYTCTGTIWDADGQETGETRTTSGVTNEKGEFTCAEGDKVEFSIGSYVIGSTTAYNNPIVTLDEIGLGGTEAVVNVAQLLQTIDDKSIDGVLTIPDNFTALNDVPVSPYDPSFDTEMAEILGVTSLVSEADAQAHLDETKLTLLLAEKTLYHDKGGEYDYLASLSFNTDVTSVTVTTLDGPKSGETRVQVVSVVGNTLVIGDGSLVFTEATSDYLLFNTDVRFYFDEAKARAYFL